jgi:predicted RNase H-like HicB family nuclease
VLDFQGLATSSYTTAVLNYRKTLEENKMRHVLLRPGEDGYIIVECPSLPGCISQGKTEEEALANIKEAIDLWVEDAEMHDESIPDDVPLKLAEV